MGNWYVVVGYTFIQIGLAAVTFGISQFVSWGNVFPALIALFVPVRSFIISKIFLAEDLMYLDPVSETDEDYIIEQIQYETNNPDHPQSVQEYGLGIAEFRTSGVPHDQEEFDNKLRHRKNK